ncbi:MAG: hypothetical protein GY745_17620 [Actinomycetia bacterium]|nr:hypothetical protein [Actinomycetes bacterium]MCP3913662.1 hypothetical protein [Actinomycetes bacterium]MCP4086850.1 hypothetical protein [Actinomycetes bacterium]
MKQGRDEGQATVELALVLPVVVLMLLLVMQVGLVIRDQVMLVHSAREAARAAAVDDDSGAARTGALAGSRLDGDRLEVSTSGRGEAGSYVTVTLTYPSLIDLPFVGRLIDDIELEASATMRVEEKP